nr:4'-phosphopantetheinyl transferase superfamily protein [Sagittula salina]
MEQLHEMVAQFARPGLGWGVARVGETAPLAEVERQAMARAIPARVAEFTAGRIAARRALAVLGHPAAPIPMQADRVPLWPKGFMGSISHAAGLAVAVVCALPARVGVDLEEDGPLDDALQPEILTPVEYGQDLRRVFSAKEAVFKAEYPAHRVMHGFHGLVVDLTKGSAQYTDHPEVATLRPDSLESRPETLPVQQLSRGGLILSLSWRRC